MKCCLEYAERFGFIADARSQSAALLGWHNNQHHHSSLVLLTPADVHHGCVAERIAVRDEALRAAFAANPHRFVHGAPCAARPPEAAWINPPLANADADPGRAPALVGAP